MLLCAKPEKVFWGNRELPSREAKKMRFSTSLEAAQWQMRQIHCPSGTLGALSYK